MLTALVDENSEVMDQHVTEAVIAEVVGKLAGGRDKDDIELLAALCAAGGRPMPKQQVV